MDFHAVCFLALQWVCRDTLWLYLLSVLFRPTVSSCEPVGDLDCEWSHKGASRAAPGQASMDKRMQKFWYPQSQPRVFKSQPKLEAGSVIAIPFPGIIEKSLTCGWRWRRG